MILIPSIKPAIKRAGKISQPRKIITPAKIIKRAEEGPLKHIIDKERSRSGLVRLNRPG